MNEVAQNDSFLMWVVAPIITGIFAVLGQWLISRQKSKEQEIKDAVRYQRIEDRLDRIEEIQTRQEKKIDEHNGYAQKFSNATRDIALLRKDFEILKK